MDSHFQRKQKGTFIVELMIEGTCPSKGLHGIETLIFHNVLNTKFWKLSILMLLCILELISFTMPFETWMTFWLTKVMINLVAVNVIILSHLFICVVPSSKISALTDVIRNCVSFLQDDICSFLSIYFWPLQKCTWRPEWLRFL